jgi:DNA modification methylase
MLNWAKTWRKAMNKSTGFLLLPTIAKPDVTSSPGINEIIQGNCLEVLKTIPDNSIDCCVTSPPYFGLRDYGTTQQIGLEETPELFIEKLTEVFTEVKRILKKEGTLWLNLGDSYNGYPANVTRGGAISGVNQHARQFKESGYGLACKSLKPKDLIGIPWMVAFSLRSSGWYLRQDIIWHKPNPMPESITDRCTKAHEYIFLLSKSAKYYYDHEAIKTQVVDATIQRMMQQIEKQKGSERVPGKTNGTMKAVGPGRKPRKGVDTNGGNQASDKGIPAMALNGNGVTGHSGYFDKDGNLIGEGKANKKSVWTVTTKPFSEAHFATFPQDLIVDCIKAGCPENGIVLDPFMGAGTTALVARKLNRNFLGIELNEEYIKIANKRLNSELGMFR